MSSVAIGRAQKDKLRPEHDATHGRYEEVVSRTALSERKFTFSASDSCM